MYNVKNFADLGGNRWNVNGVLRIKGADIAAIIDGNAWYVDSVTGSNSNDGTTWDTAVATIDYAVGLATANNGDRIYVASGHVEDIVAAGTLTCDKAGVEIVGVGVGNDRPKLTFKTDVGASVLITAASTKIINVIGLSGIDGLTNPFHVQAADAFLDITWRDDSAAVEAIRTVLTTAAASRLRVNLQVYGQTGGDACVNAVRLVGVNGAKIHIDFYGLASTAVVEFHTTACTNVEVTGRSYNQGTSNFTKLIVDTVTGSTWSWRGWDGEACSNCSGGQDFPISGDDVSDVMNEVEIIDHHLHGKQRWYGLNPAHDEVTALANVLTPFRVTSGVGTYGSEVCVVGSGDELIPGIDFFDLHKVLVVGSQKAEIYKFRMVWGTGTHADAVTAGQYSTFMMNFVTTTGKIDSLEIMMPRLATGTKVWLCIWSVTDSQWADLFIGGHGYP